MGSTKHRSSSITLQQSELAGLGNTLYIAVESTKGDVFDAALSSRGFGS